MMKKWLFLFVLVSLVLPLLMLPRTSAQSGFDNRPPEAIVGTYQTTYYANFRDWDIFPVLLPMRNADTRLPYPERFDLTYTGQIFGNLRGETASGDYRINLPPNPESSAWFDTDGNPETPSGVKVFIAGIASGLIEETYVSRYDFIYARSYNLNPETRLWRGQVLVWSAEEGARFPLLNGDDNRHYTADDVFVTVPAGWSAVEVRIENGREVAQVYQDSLPTFELNEPPQFSDVDLTALDYESAFVSLLDALERTYVFTEYRGVDWANLRDQYASKSNEISSVEEYHRLLENALFSFYDGHLAVISPGIPAWYWGSIGLQTYPVEDGLMLISVARPSPAADSILTPGTVITGINGQSALDVFGGIQRTIYSTGHPTQENWRRGSLTFHAEPGTAFSLDYRTPDGTSGNLNLTAAPISEVGGALRVPAPLVYEITPEGVGIVRVYNFTSADIDALWDEAVAAMQGRGVTGIILDLRRNGGGFSSLGNYMLGAFLDENVYAGQRISAMDEDGDGEGDISQEYYYGRGRVFDPARVAVLIGPECYSACEFTAYAFRSIGARTFGYLTSAGAGGGVGATYYLPGSVQIYGMGVVRTENAAGDIIVEGVGVPLDVEVPFTAEGLASGQDVVEQAALDWLTAP